jgi:hypothetical protein
MIRREDYKAVKRMNRIEMDEYLQTIYRHGFEAGTKAKKTVPSPAIVGKTAPENPARASEAKK